MILAICILAAALMVASLVLGCALEDFRSYLEVSSVCRR